MGLVYTLCAVALIKVHTFVIIIERTEFDCLDRVT